MSTEITVSAWIAKVLKARPNGAKPQKGGYAGTRNGNIKGSFATATTLKAGDQEFEVPEGTEFCVFQSMGGSGTAATVYDYKNGLITIKQNGQVFQKRPEATPTPAQTSVMVPLPLGLGW